MCSLEDEYNFLGFKRFILRIKCLSHVFEDQPRKLKTLTDAPQVSYAICYSTLPEITTSVKLTILKAAQ